MPWVGSWPSQNSRRSARSSSCWGRRPRARPRCGRSGRSRPPRRSGWACGRRRSRRRWCTRRALPEDALGAPEAAHAEDGRLEPLGERRLERRAEHLVTRGDGDRVSRPGSGHRAVLLRDRRRRLHADPHPRRPKVTTIDRRETAPAAMRPDSFFEDGQPLPFGDGALQRAVRRRARHGRRWDAALAATGRCRWRALRPAIAVARDGFAVDQTFVDQTEAERRLLRRRSVDGRIYLDPDGTPRDVGTNLRNPDLARAYERIGQPRREGLLRGRRSPTRWSRAAQHPPIAPDADHVWRPGLMTIATSRLPAP